MKNPQKGFVVPLLIGIIALLIVGGGIYIYSQKSSQGVKTLKNEATNTNKQNNNSSDLASKKSLTDEDFIKVAPDTQGKVVAKGDLNGDGYEDAIVQGVNCGVSCSISLFVVLNNKNANAELAVSGDNFQPGYRSSSAIKSKLTNVSIENGIISLTGYGLDCGGNPALDTNICTEKEWHVLRTIKFKLDSTNGASKYYTKRI